MIKTKSRKSDTNIQSDFLLKNENKQQLLAGEVSILYCFKRIDIIQHTQQHSSFG